MTDIDPLLGRTLPPPSGPPQPPFVPSARSTTELPVRATARTTRPRRRHPAIGGRIVAAGLGATTMFGLIAVMGVAQAASSSTTSTPAVDTSIPLAPLPTITPVPTVTPAPAATSAPVVAAPDPNVAAAQAAPAPTVVAAPAAPIVLQARPDVQVVTPAPAQAAPAPVATTSGSG